MVDRREDIIVFCQEFLEKELIKTKNEVMENYERNADQIFETIKTPFNRVFTRAKNKKVKFIVVNFVYSSLMTDSKEFLIAVYDELFYLDLGAVSEKVKFQFLDFYFNRDVENLTKLTEKKFSRLTEYEKAAIKIECGLQYLKIWSAYLQKISLKVTQLETFKRMEKDEDFKIILGEYIGQGEVIYGK